MSGPELSAGASGEEVRQLQASLLRGGYHIPAREVARGFFGPATRQAVRHCQARNRLPVTGVVEARTAAAIGLPAVEAGVPRLVPAVAPAAGPASAATGAGGEQPDTPYTVCGAVTSPGDTAVGGLRVQLVDTDAGSGDVLLGDTTTDPGGRYEVSVAVSPAALEARHKTQPDLQVRVLSGSTFLAASEVRYHASTTETLTVTLPAGVPALEQADGYLPSPDVLARRPDSTGASPPRGALPTSAGQSASADTPAARVAPATAAPMIALRPAAAGGPAAGPSSPRLAGPGGDPGGSGPGGPGKPGQWRVYVTCVVRSPGDGAAISGAEPGAQFAVVVQAGATADNGLAQEDVDVRVSVAVDGRGFAATQDPDGNFTAQCRVYRSGLLTVTATATAVGFGGGSKDSTVHVQASLDSASPSLTVKPPADGARVPVGVSGADVPVTVTMADSDQFGAHTVVVQLDQAAPVTLPPSAGSTTQYTGTVHLTAKPLGVPRVLAVTGTCAGTTLSTSATVTVVAQGPAPRVWVTHPTDKGLAAAIPSATDPTTFTVWISGGADDAVSGMVGGQASVKAMAADGPWVTATPGSPGDWSSWTVDALPFTVPSPPADGSIVPLGTFPLFIQATDAVGNATSIASSFRAIKAWVPTTLDDGPDGPGRLSSLEYLRDLINFAGDNMWWTPPVSPPLHPISKPLSADGLAQVLGQPIDAISQPATPPAAAAQVPINELRVPIEILRTDLADGHITASAAGQTAYLSAAYQMLLAGLGTSYAELRAARGADSGDRMALAARIGIPLYGLEAAETGAAPPHRCDQLDALTLDGPALTELALQDLFGLIVTTPFDPQHLPPIQSSPKLPGWQVEALRNLWQSRDARPPAPVAYTVIVDPDIITPADVRADGLHSQPVLDLLAARAAQLAGQANTLNAARNAAASAADGGLSALLAAGLPAGVDIAALHTQEKCKGADIRGQLAAAGLDRTGFGYLVQMQTLAASAGPLITASEWADAVDVLVGACRRRQYAAWTAPDPATGTTAEAGIALSPDTFKITGNPPPAGPLRIDPTARQDWQATLRARTVQRQALQDAMAEQVAAAERAALPVLRDALLTDIAKSPRPATAAASGSSSASSGPGPTDDPATWWGEHLTRRYQTDMLVSGALTTTRLDQAITSLQTLLLLVRSGENTKAGDTPNDPLTSLTLSTTNAAFDDAWAWIGTLSSWRSATTTFLFPEAALDPGQFGAAASAAKGNAFSTAFITLRDALSAGPGLDVRLRAHDYVYGTPTVPGARAMLQAWAQDAAEAADARAAFLMAAAQTFDYSPETRSTDAQGTLRQESQAVGEVDSNLALSVALEVFWAVPMLLAQRLHADGRYQAALDWLWIAFPYTESDPVSAYDVINTELATDPDRVRPSLTINDWTAFDPLALITGRPYPHLRATLLAIIACLLDYADSEFATETGESIAHARNLYRTAADLLTHPRFEPVTPSTPDAKLPIPQLAVLKTRAGNQLAKMRQDRNIAGLPRTQIVSSGDPVRQPTPYHFKVLLARAQQLAQQATTLEGEYLSALEKYFNKELQLADAQNAAGVAAAQLTVHAAQVQQATDACTAAQAQHTKACTMVSTYTSAISAPPNDYESALLGNYSDMRDAQDVIATGDMAIGLGQAAASVSMPWQIGFAAGESVGVAARFGGQLWLNDIQNSMQGNQLRASIEDRKQEWQIQLASAQQDVLVAAAQVTTANDQVKIAAAERTVAGLQAAQAAAALDLLKSQFTSPGMYKWLSDTLGGVYRYFLQQATATATLAQAQLAFERAEPARAFVRSDYWQPLTAPPGGDARGLTGAERLAADLSKLDQYAFSTDSRRLNVSQTFSLAALAPVEFLGFRATGQISVATPAALFDRDFPGHYQRLIRQARLSVVALVPPSRGIRATLASYGISRVTTPGNGVFGEVLLRRDPSVVALTSPVDASGVFTADLQPDMLLPFEGSGVDTTWELTLPPAANPFDFRTISDVLLTIDYTALLDLDYQAQVIRRLNADRTRSADRVFSLAADFPDQWYALNNPAPSTTGRATTVTLRDIDFPPGITSLITAQIAVRLSGAGPFAPIKVTLTRGGNSGVATTDASGTASTRRGGSDWTGQFVGFSPAGDWQLSFDPSADPLFTPGSLDDVLLVIGWTGQAPAWPA